VYTPVKTPVKVHPPCAVCPPRTDRLVDETNEPHVRHAFTVCQVDNTSLPCAARWADGVRRKEE
jgi:hypothetical protein